MKYKTYQERWREWNEAREQVSKHNEGLIKKWRSIPWWQFWKKPSFEQQRQIIVDNWERFKNL